jgi:putative membrane protein
MTRNINRAVRLTSYFITLPPTPYLLAAMVLLGILFGLIVNPAGQPDLLRAVVDGLMLLTLPALLTTLVVKLLIRKMSYKRIAGTALGGEAVYTVAYSIGLLLTGVNPLWSQLVVLVGSALVFVFWYVIARFIFILKYRSILFAIIQLLFYLVFLFSNPMFYSTSEPFIDVAAKFYLSSFVLLGSLALFFYIINAPMKKNFGLSSTDAMSYFFSQWLYHNKDLEKAFEQVGEPARTLMCLMGFKRKKDTVFFLTPYVHFGPFGNLGGSEFSYLLAKEMDRRYKSRTFVFHGTVTHDLNPVSSSQMDRILNAVDASVKGAAYRKASVSLSSARSKECQAQTLRVNDAAMVGLSRAPYLTEDINFGLGLAMMYQAEKNVRNAMVVDQHNAETGDVSSFEPGSDVGFNYLKAVDEAMSKKPKGKPLKIGIATRAVESDVLGKAGLKVAIFSSSPEYVVVLIDANGITPEFRDEIEREVKAIGKSLKRRFEVGVFTTDTHQTNIIKGVLNPLKEEETLLSAIRDACQEAVSDMQEASFFSDKRWFGIDVLGAKQSIEVVSTVNSIVAVAKITLPLVLIGGLLLLFAVATKI